MLQILKQACAALSLLLCCGCMAISASGKSTGALPEATAERLTTATGRFVEADVTPPVNGAILAVVPHGDGTADVFSLEAQGILERFRFTGGGSWEREALPWAKTAVEKYGGNCEFSAVTATESGLCYAVLSGADGKLHFVEARLDGTFREIPVPAWEAGGFTVKTVTALENGDFGFTYEGRAAEVIDKNTGRSKAAFGNGTGGVFAGDRFAADEGGSIVFYDAASSRRLDAVAVAKGRVGAALAADESGAVYVATQSGIGRLPAGGSVFEAILESGGYSFDGADRIEALARQPGADVFYLLLSRKGKPALLQYTYTADAPVRPDTQLDVFSMEESSTVQRAVIELQRADPSVTVRYQVAAESPLSREETLRALENELKNGKGPDVLILDGMESTIYEGRLADPGEPEDLKNCFPNIAAAGVRNGKRYAIPTRFLLPVTVGEVGEIAQYGPAGNGKPTSSVIQGTPMGRRSFNEIVSNSWYRSVANAADMESYYRELTLSPSGTLQPALFAAVNAGSGNQEQARRLIALMLTDFVQRGDFEEGMPVRTASFDEIVKEQMKDKDINIVTDFKAMCLSQTAADSPPDQGTVDSLKTMNR